MRPTRSFGSENNPELRNHARILAGNISFGLSNTDPAKNVAGYHAQNVTTPASANTEFTITHNLGYIPQRFWVTNINANATIYQSTTPWTATAIYLKCSGSSTTVSLFID